MSTQPGLLTRGAAFATVATGFVAMAAGAQVAAVFVVVGELARLVPMTLVGLGLMVAAAGVALAIPKAWARLPAVLGLLGLVFVGVPWVGWLLWNGAFTPLTLFTPAFAAFALVGVGVSWREVGRVARAMAEVERENARMLEEARRSGDPMFASAPSTGWFLPIVGTLLAVPVAFLALAILAPAALQWAQVRIDGLLAGKSPLVSGWVADARSFPYSGSPFEWYLDYEGRWVELPRAEILAVADDVADEVAWRLAAETGAADPVAAEDALWAAGREKELQLWIAEALRARGAYYSPESLLSRSFDADLHVVPDTIHLDCDQLVYLYLHVAWRLDLAMAAVPSPFHVYLRYGAPDGTRAILVETTQFRHVDVRGNHVDFLGAGIGEDYFPELDYYASGRNGTWASPEIVAAAGLYEPWRERDIQDSIVANVLLGLERQGADVPYEAEMVAHLNGSRDITLVANLYSRLVEQAEAAIARGDGQGAVEAARRARAVRESHGVLVVRTDAPDLRLEEQGMALVAPAPG